MKLLHLLIVSWVITTAALTDFDLYNVAGDSPSADAKGSLPVGNGDIGLNAWVEPSGDLVLLVSKTDAWDENMRLVKVGKVCVTLTSPAVQAGKPFTQTLQLAPGRVLMRTGHAEVSVWVDANHPVIQVDAKSLTGQPLAAAAAEPWRTSKQPCDPGYPDFPGFPAFWGPNFDWMPDRDHGAGTMSAFQRMLVQYEGRKIFVLPAWPKDSNTSFKFHAPYQTTVEGVYRNGKLQELKVTPPERQKDVVV